MEIEFETFIGKLSHLVGVHYLEIPAEVVIKLGGIGKHRFICKINDQLSFQCGLVALGEGKAYINLTTKRMKSAGLKVGAIVKVSFEVDKSEFGLDVPEELIECLNQDSEAKRRFDLLAPGKRRVLIYLVLSVKNCQIRIDRSLKLLENLKSLPLGKETNSLLFNIKNG